MSASHDVIAWLMAGDPAIRWQTMRDLLDAPEQEWKAEHMLCSRIRVAALLEHKDR